MESLTQSVHRYTFDVLDTTDVVTYTSSVAQGSMLHNLDYAHRILEEINEKLDSHVPPNTGKDDSIFKYWREGGCMREDEQCDKPSLYDNSFGFTKDLCTSGLEHQIFKFIESGNVFLKEKQYIDREDSEAFKLVQAMSNNFRTFFKVLINSYNKYAAESTISATVALFSLATCVFISFDIYYRIGTLILY